MLVADIGNTRIKWGMCGATSVERAVSLPDDSEIWRKQLAAWSIESPQNWVLAGVVPALRDELASWLRQTGHRVEVVSHFSQLPLTVAVDAPETVGMDRLLNALAAKNKLPSRTPAVIVDAGSAVTVDLLNMDGEFAGGAIFPGLRLMAEALHDFTALLPLVKSTEYPTNAPGRSTPTAIAAGIHWAVVGGVMALVRELNMSAPSSDPLNVFVTGGDAAAIAPDLMDRELYRYHHDSLLTLEGIRLAGCAK